MSPYHTREIDRGEYGELSKIYEEVEEVKDAEFQTNPILVLCELADLIGAVDGYVKKHHNMSIEDVLKMAKLNQKAFEYGYRT